MATGKIKDLFPPGNNAAAMATQATAKRAASQVGGAPPFGGDQKVYQSTKAKIYGTEPAVSVQISDAGRAALAAAQPPTPPAIQEGGKNDGAHKRPGNTRYESLAAPGQSQQSNRVNSPAFGVGLNRATAPGLPWYPNRVYNPGDAHYGKATARIAPASATGAAHIIEHVAIKEEGVK